jgi:tRNA dimethylallyltransferase
LEIAISIEKEQLNAKIKSRLEQRLKEPASTRGNDRSSTRGGGMIAEVQNLHKKGVSYEWMERIGLEYRWIARFLQDQITENEMREKLYFDIIHYAKRQMTWLKKNKNIIWQSNYQDIEKEVAKFLAQ